MKKYHKKRLAAFKVGLVLSIMITPFCFWKIAGPVHALSNVITYNNYGSFERINQTITVGGVVGFSAAAVRGNLNGTYDGTVRIYITISGGHTIADFSVVPTNCFIQYYSSSYIDIAFNGVSQWEVAFIGTTYNAHSYITIDSLTNWNMLYIYQSTDNMIKTTMGYLDDLEGYVGRCNASIIRCENLLTTIANNGGGSGGSSSTVNNIDINVDHIADDLNLLKTSSDDILSSLLDFFADGLGNIITIQSVIDAIDDVELQLQDVNLSLTSIDNQLTTINTTLNNINNNLQNIDNTIDTITWLDAEFIYKGYTTDFTTFDNSPGSKASGGYVVFKRKDTAPSYTLSSLLKISFPLFDAYDRNNILFSRVAAPTTFLDYSILYTYKNRQNTLYYLTLNDIAWPFANDDYYISIKLNVNTYVYNPTLFAYSNYIDDNDIEYWNLLNYFNQYKYNKLILEAIKNVSFSVTNTTVQDTINNVNNYNSTMNQVHNVENNYTNQFNTFNPVVQSELNTKLQIPNGFIEGTNFIKRLFPRVIDNSSLVGFPFMLILAAVVLFVILG